MGRSALAGIRLSYRDDSAPDSKTGTGPSPPDVAAAIKVSYRKLAEPTARMFRLLPVNPGPDLSTAAAAELADQQVSEVRDDLANLAQAHLVEATMGSGRRWRMPDPIRHYAQQLSDAHAEADDREQARGRLLGYYLSLTEAADARLRALPGMSVPDEFTDRDSALAWLDEQRASLIGAVQLAAETGWDQAAMRLPLLLAQYFVWRRRFDDLLATTTIGLRVAKRLGDLAHQGDALNNLGSALQELFRFEEAVKTLREAAAIFRQTGDLVGEGDALNNLGLALKATLRFSEAITAHQAAAGLYRETGDRHSEGNALNNLGLALRAERRLDEAIMAHQQAIVIYRETGDRPREGKALNNLGGALRESGRPAEAVRTFRTAATIFRDAGDKYREGIALENLEKARAMTSAR
jgi:tetratricopeptide (TPR) repeat protein